MNSLGLLSDEFYLSNFVPRIQKLISQYESDLLRNNYPKQDKARLNVSAYWPIANEVNTVPIL